MFITLGTGVGGGIIVGGKLLTGVNDSAGELGHMVIEVDGRECACGRRGCWERYASATAIIQSAKEMVQNDNTSLLHELSKSNIDAIDGQMIFEAFAAGDLPVKQIVDNYIKYLAAGILNIINMLEPEMICIGGGISNAWEHIESPLKKIIDDEKYLRFSPNSPQTQIVKAKLGNDAGIIGAALLGVSGG